MIGVELRKARLAARLTQEQVAQKAGVTREYVSMLERNQKSPTLDTLFRVCRALVVSPSTLIRRIER